jgi:hypothetical protein
MKLTGHKTEAVYRCYAITSAAGLSEGVAKLATLHTGPQGSPTVLPFTKGNSGTIRGVMGERRKRHELSKQFQQAKFDTSPTR